MTRSDRPLFGLWTVLGLVLALTVFRFWVNAGLDPLPLSGDEAQYWLYGEHPAGGYYSKPPLLPWLMRLSTELFGASAWAMRLPTLVLHLGVALCLYAIGRDLFQREVGVVAALVYLTTPAISVSSMFASTDPPMLLGWALATLALIRAQRRSRAHLGWWTLIGFAVGFGLLGKYTMIAWVLAVALIAAFDPYWRQACSTRGVLVGLAAALVTVSPNLVWNALNGFPTITHLGENANLGVGAARAWTDRAGELGAFLGSQVGVFGPIAAAILVWLWSRPWAWREPAFRLLFGLGLPLLLIIATQAWLNRANANWAAPVYLGFTLAVAAWLVRTQHRRLAHWLVGTNLAAMIAIVAIAHANQPEPTAWSRLWDPFRLLRGVDQIGDQVAPLLAAEPDRWLLMTDRMLMANVLERTSWPLERAIMWNPDGRITNHFDLVTAFPDDADARFLLVMSRGDPAAITARFDRAELWLRTEVQTHADRALPLVVYRLEGFQGYP
ncbi:MAG: phospholipid carrier-dependent glycosyltransferase [Geminicoccaceae bacterium]|nr:MAG: phospholipid carrier-dependent glycosyltransferase [Geminicoccaceae bacterium]